MKVIVAIVVSGLFFNLGTCTLCIYCNKCIATANGDHSRSCELLKDKWEKEDGGCFYIKDLHKARRNVCGDRKDMARACEQLKDDCYECEEGKCNANTSKMLPRSGNRYCYRCPGKCISTSDFVPDECDTPDTPCVTVTITMKNEQRTKITYGANCADNYEVMEFCQNTYDYLKGELEAIEVDRRPTVTVECYSCKEDLCNNNVPTMNQEMAKTMGAPNRLQLDSVLLFVVCTQLIMNAYL